MNTHKNKEVEKYEINLTFNGSRSDLEDLFLRAQIYLASESPRTGLCRYSPKGTDTSTIKTTREGNAFKIEGKVSEQIYYQLINEGLIKKQS